MKVPPQILLYELTRSVGDPEKLKQATQELKGVAKFTQELYDTLRSLQSAADGELKKLKPSKEQEAADSPDGKLGKPIDIRSEQQKQIQAPEPGQQKQIQAPEPGQQKQIQAPEPGQQKQIQAPESSDEDEGTDSEDEKTVKRVFKG